MRIAVLKFGTVDWELNVIKAHGLDKAEGIDLQIVEAANTPATTVALEAGAADIIVTDWLWVSRQRAEGAGFMVCGVGAGAILKRMTVLHFGQRTSGGRIAGNFNG